MARLKQVYNECIDALKSIKGDRKGKLCSHVNIWDSQIDEIVDWDENNNYSFNMPAAFVEIELGDAQVIGGRVKSYPEAIIRIHTLTQILNTRGGKMERNELTFDVTDEIEYFMCNINLSFCASLISHENIQDWKHGSVYKHTISYRTNFIDTAGSIFDERNGSEWYLIPNPFITIKRTENFYVSSPDCLGYTSFEGKSFAYSH